MNRLARETSPYLLQHKDNPVHWYAWNDEAFEEARKQNRPILLSVGYAACHWCHVMAHECFEDESIAALMNTLFINIKVDREERPDIDRVYMTALHALGEQGGWPLTMFLTPDAQPFWGGTYFPPTTRHGRPGFPIVLSEISRIWNEEPDKIINNAQAIASALAAKRPAEGPALTFTANHIRQAANVLARAVDPQAGGFRGAPKFPQAPHFTFLWSAFLSTRDPTRAAAVHSTMQHISNGGIYDHLGGGLARYATDAQWLVPHFEKMLYDNAQYISLLSSLHLHTPSRLYQTRVAETVDFVIHHMTTPEGMFTSSYDADSEGEEGRYYVWTYSEIAACLGADFPLFADTYDVTPGGNWEGRTILNRTNRPFPQPAHEDILTQSRAKLLALRSHRTPPLHDDKVLLDWNALMVTALCKAALAFHDHSFLDTARSAFAALKQHFWADGTLHHSRRCGITRHTATADDYANFIEAALWLFQITASPEYLEAAQVLTRAFHTYHWDETARAFTHASRTVNLPAKLATIEDDATPNANAMMISNLIRLHRLTGEPAYEATAATLIQTFASAALSNPFSAPTLLRSAAMMNESIEITLHGDPIRSPLLAQALQRTGFDITLRCKAPAPQRESILLCRAQTCAKPANNKARLEEAFAVLGLTP
jgi:uncharacterized protein YyaL (SSP411 family)